MAKNRSMAIKHAKAKKCMMEEIMDNAKHEMCCKSIQKNIHYNNKPYAYYDNIFYSKFAIQRRIDVLIGKHYPANEFCKDWNDIYQYIATHTVPETQQCFNEILSIIKGECNYD